MARKQTANQLAYKKQQARLKRIISRGIKQGYTFQENIIPAMPKRVTKASINRIKNIKASDIYKRAEFVNFETGEVITGTERRKQIRQEAYVKARTTRKQNALEQKLKNTIKKELESSIKSALNFGTDETETIDNTDEKNYYPTLNIYNTLVSKISAMPDTLQVYDRRTGFHTLEVSQYKSEVLTTLSDNLAKDESDYLDYLYDNQGEIISASESVVRASSGEDVSEVFAVLFSLIKGSPLSVAQRIASAEQGKYV